METSSFVCGIMVALVFALLRYIEYKFIQKEPILLKKIVQESLMVYLSYIMGHFIYGQVIDPLNKLSGSPNVFTTEPDF
mgnify:CR=1 FL=1|tara:strand:- start:3087 stop:3323 length:237 start_codon:yes stop_codon:yes gene_type:complete